MPIEGVEMSVAEAQDGLSARRVMFDIIHQGIEVLRYRSGDKALIRFVEAPFRAVFIEVIGIEEGGDPK